MPMLLLCRNRFLGGLDDVGGVYAVLAPQVVGFAAFAEGVLGADEADWGWAGSCQYLGYRAAQTADYVVVFGRDDGSGQLTQLWTQSGTSQMPGADSGCSNPTSQPSDFSGLRSGLPMNSSEKKPNRSTNVGDFWPVPTLA